MQQCHRLLIDRWLRFCSVDFRKWREPLAMAHRAKKARNANRHSSKWIELLKMWRWKISPNKKECTLKPPRTSTLHLLFFSIFSSLGSHTEEGSTVVCSLVDVEASKKTNRWLRCKSFLYLWTFSFSFSVEALWWCAIDFCDRISLEPCSENDNIPRWMGSGRCKSENTNHFCKLSTGYCPHLQSLPILNQSGRRR